MFAWLAFWRRRPDRKIRAVERTMDCAEMVDILGQVNVEIAEAKARQREWTATMRRATIRKVK